MHQAKHGSFKDESAEIWVVPVFSEKRALGSFATAIDGMLNGALNDARAEDESTGKKDEVVVFRGARAIRAKRVLLVGLGKRESLDREGMRRFGAVIAREAAAKSKKIAVAFGDIDCADEETCAFAQALVEGYDLATYDFDRFKEKKKSLGGALLLLTGGKKSASYASDGIRRGVACAAGQNTARDLSNMPANHGTPDMLASTAKKIGKSLGIDVRVFGPKEIEKMKMGAFLSVSLGSPVPPRLIQMQWNASKKKLPCVAIVGKGLTFDSGGISIKSADGMDKMRHDKSGGCAVIGAFEAVAKLKLPIRLVGIVPATENMPGGNANKPGDIVTAKNGKTIEILNTDAEGRLVLADGLTHALGFKPDVVIDLATLTGACMVALGSHCAAVMTRDDELARDLVRAGQSSHERLWRMPLWDEYVDEMRGSQADLKNLGGRYGGALTAAAFLEAFTEKSKWAHLDIAGVSWDDGTRLYNKGKGATGFGVRLLVEYLTKIAER